MRKTITIKRKPNSTNLPDHVYDSAKRRIGSVFTTTGDIHTGLTVEEMEKLMPRVLGVNPNDPAFFKQCKEWFMDLSIDVSTAGIDLQIGVDEKGMPYEVLDYVKYKFALKHPYLLSDPDNGGEVAAKRSYTFYVEDKNKEKIKKIAAKDSRKKAYAEYIKLNGNEEKMDQILRVLGEYPESMDKGDKDIILENLALKEADRFLEVATNKDLETKAFISKCVSTEVIRKVGNTFLNGEEILGGSIEEVILYLKDKKNSEVLLILQARLKEFTKA